MPTIVVIDDHEPTRKFIQHICIAHGFDCLISPTAEEGISLAQCLKPSAIFVDLQLPGNLNGWEAIHTIKNDAILKDTRVIAITAGNHQDTATNAGSDDYLRKPFTGQQILNAIAAC
jgi:DNA-binding response OmpR family regulator